MPGGDRLPAFEAPVKTARLLPFLLAAALGTLAAARAKPPAPKNDALKEEVAVIETRFGRIVFRFFPDEAPGHVAYVKELIGRGFYDGTTFHRVIPHFVIQGGDPNSKDEIRENDGEGEADRRLKAEFSAALHYRPGTVGMAREADPNSGSCQFFIALENLPRLDGKYTIFGEVIEGIEVARKIAAVPRDLKDNPLNKVPMKVTLKTARVPGSIDSFRQGEGGEVLTGPGKPRPWDPGSSRWASPALALPAGQPLGTEAWPATALDLSVGEEGEVLDVRFARINVERAVEILAAVRSWRFLPARYDGKPVKARFAIDSRGGNLGPSAVPGTPRQIEGEIRPPSAAVAVPLPPGMKAPGKEPLLRLTVDETGHVADVEVEVSSGVQVLDEAALASARKMVFVPALEGKEPVSVYMNLPVRFVEAPSP